MKTRITLFRILVVVFLLTILASIPSALAGSTNVTSDGVKFPDGTTQSTAWISSGSDIYYNNGNVGIGTTIPLNKLHIAGNFPQLLIQSDASGNLGYEGLFLGQTESGTLSLTGWIGDTNNLSRELVVGASSSYPLILYQNGEVRMTINNGKVGIGTTSPTAPLHLGSGVPGGQASIQLENNNGSWGKVGRWTNRLQIRSSNAIGFSAGGTDMSGHLWITNSGNVGIGTTSPSYPLEMASGAHVTTGGVWTNASSREYKENIRDLSYDEATSALSSLKPSKFNYKVDKDDDYLGFIAEDVPDLVATKDRKGLSPMDIVAVLTKVVQQQQKTISALSKKMTELKKELRSKEAPI